MTYGSVIVETRPLENLSQIIKRHVKYLPKQWQMLVFCSKENEHLVPDTCKKVVLPEAFMSINEYNRLLTSMWFWNNIPFEKCLIFQHDSEIFRKWDNKFEQWDYIGAPWTFQRHGGNGGLSWRSVAAMKFCISKTEWISVMGNEDVYFCNILHNTTEYKLADRMTCSEFACETIYQPSTFGAHAIDKWLTKEQCNTLRKGHYEKNAIRF